MAALLVTSAAVLVWLRAYLTTGYVPMLPVLGGASLATFVVAAIGYPVAALLWIDGRGRAARVVGSAAAAGWLLTAVVFQLLLGGSLQVAGEIEAPQSALLAWTFLAVVAAAGLWQPPSRARRSAATVLLVTIAVVVFTARGGVQLQGASGYLVVDGGAGWLPAGLDRGPFDTLHTGAFTAWVLLLVTGIGCWWIDRRLALAACWLAPFVAFSQLGAAGPAAISIGLVAVVAVVALAVHSSPPGRT
ncbi:MAG: hypothetical protein WEB03_12745 [Nitriliruptor sp.]|uniref:hypothetical protein n=1 Tax=Nitriliruptor sp. TaxID=2448056 RepID=UPI0034A0ACB3